MFNKSGVYLKAERVEITQKARLRYSWGFLKSRFQGIMPLFLKINKMVLLHR
jgi:hypothetical protein